jgi:hypothetical protein
VCNALPKESTGLGTPRATDLFALVEHNFDQLERVWDERYQRQFGFWRPIIRHVVEQYMDCGDLHCGFARLHCPSCRKDLLLPYTKGVAKKSGKMEAGSCTRSLSYRGFFPLQSRFSSCRSSRWRQISELSLCRQRKAVSYGPSSVPQRHSGGKRRQSSKSPRSFRLM